MNSPPSEPSESSSDPASTPESAPDTAPVVDPVVAPDGAGDALPRLPQSDRLLWIGAAVALAAHIIPFLYFARSPDALGDDVLTEAIAVELVDKATLEGRDQTPPSPPSAGAPPSPPPQQRPAEQGPPQKPQAAVPPAPPPSQPAKKAEESPAEAEQLPAFKGDGGIERAQKAQEKSENSPDDGDKEKPAPVKPPTPPPRKAVAPRAPAAPAQPSAKPSPPRQQSAPALAKSGEVTQFAKDVVAALAKAKPAAPRTKENKAITGKVQVTVVVAPQGGIRVAKVTGSSGNDALDQLALEAARQAAVPSPPPDVTTDDLFYDVEYSFQ